MNIACYRFCIDWFTSQTTIFQCIYVTVHRCADGLKKIFGLPLVSHTIDIYNISLAQTRVSHCYRRFIRPEPLYHAVGFELTT